MIAEERLIDCVHSAYLMIGYADHEVYEFFVISISVVGSNGKKAKGDRATGRKGKTTGTAGNRQFCIFLKNSRYPLHANLSDCETGCRRIARLILLSNHTLSPAVEPTLFNVPAGEMTLILKKNLYC